ncbi:MAG TPA: ATP-binding protein [Ktedonobacteraceae bacterium]|nr:ATP-binding protein [Ktedonobacteraceae bacterium]
MNVVEHLPAIEERKAPTWRSFLYDTVLAIAGALLITAIIFLLHLYPRIPNISFAYLLVVLALASTRGLYASILTSVTAFLSFDYYLVPPIYTFTIQRVDEWLALFFFLAVSIITAQFATALRKRAEEARRHEREMHILFDLVRVTNREDDLSRELSVVARAFVDVFSPWGVRACSILLPDESGALTVRASANGLAAIKPEERSSDEEATCSWVLSHGQSVKLHETSTSLQKSAYTLRVSATGRAELPDSRYALYLLPLRVGQKAVGVLRLKIEGNPHWLSSESSLDDEKERASSQTAFFWTFLEQASTMIEQASLRQETMQVEVLRRTDALRTALLSSVSHDLRTPLASIKAAASSLQQEDMQWDEEARRSFANTIEREADRLNRLVENLLDMSRIEAGALKPEKEWYSITALIQDVVGRLQPLLQTREIRASLPADLPPVKIDYLYIDQVLTNLLENATRYTPPDSPIDLSTAVKNNFILVSVADRGPGIPAGERERIFDKFYRILGSQRDTRGSGLGLAVSRGLIEAHGGRIWVEAREGGGSVFRFTLPLENIEEGHFHDE